MKKNSGKNKSDSSKKKNPEGYPLYPPGEDIYNNETKMDLDEELPLGQAKSNIIPSLDSGLDIPGADLDDLNEWIGEEDEENNYYSLGGDDHNDLEENHE